ncbi:MAG: hypothetical protein JJE50_11140 [Actinomycetales bacterium]|nr:hypothetical protein [Actinomycetales bacterium]
MHPRLTDAYDVRGWWPDPGNPCRPGEALENAARHLRAVSAESLSYMRGELAGMKADEARAERALKAKYGVDTLLDLEPHLLAPWQAAVTRTLGRTAQLRTQFGTDPFLHQAEMTALGVALRRPVML